MRSDDKLDDTEEELVMYLERDQLVADTSRPVARASSGGGPARGCGRYACWSW